MKAELNLDSLCDLSMVSKTLLWFKKYVLLGG